MKSVKCACLEQTLHFILREDQMNGTHAENELQTEVARYKQELEQSRTKFLVIDERKQPDGPIILKIKSSITAMMSAIIFRQAGE